jgi:hypothetical protein
MLARRVVLASISLLTVDDYQMLLDAFHSEKEEGRHQLRELCSQLGTLQTVKRETGSVFFCMLSGTCFLKLQRAMTESRFQNEDVFLPLMSFEDTKNMLISSLSNCEESLASFLETFELKRLLGSVGGHMRSLQFLRESLLETLSFDFKVRLILLINQ